MCNVWKITGLPLHRQLSSAFCLPYVVVWHRKPLTILTIGCRSFYLSFNLLYFPAKMLWLTIPWILLDFLMSNDLSFLTPLHLITMVDRRDMDNNFYYHTERQASPFLGVLIFYSVSLCFLQDHLWVLTIVKCVCITTICFFLFLQSGHDIKRMLCSLTKLTEANIDLHRLLSWNFIPPSPPTSHICSERELGNTFMEL